MTLMKQNNPAAFSIQYLSDSCDSSELMYQYIVPNMRSRHVSIIQVSVSALICTLIYGVSGSNMHKELKTFCPNKMKSNYNPPPPP